MRRVALFFCAFACAVCNKEFPTATSAELIDQFWHVQSNGKPVAIRE
jgi:hypothetical protein